MSQTATIEQWQASMERIEADFKQGVIDVSTYYRELRFMLEAKRQILEIKRHSKEQSNG